MPNVFDPREDDPRDAIRHDPRERDDGRRPASVDPRDVFHLALELPRGREREPVRFDDEIYHLRGSEVRTLATIGAFRVVPVDDLRESKERNPDLWHGDLDRLRSSGLIRVVAPFDRDEDTRTSLVTLTDRGRELLEHARTDDRDERQEFYAGPGRSRDLAHDAQLYAAYLRAAERLMEDGAAIRRVALDHELKREYQQFLQERNRDNPASDGRPARHALEIERWAYEHDLPFLDGHVQFPDLRLEYEFPDGREGVEHVEVTTLHYRGAHAAAKQRAGFTRFRARGGRVGGRSTRKGGRPFDPDVAGELLG